MSFAHRMDVLATKFTAVGLGLKELILEDAVPKNSGTTRTPPVGLQHSYSTYSLIPGPACYWESI